MSPYPAAVLSPSLLFLAALSSFEQLERDLIHHVNCLWQHPVLDWMYIYLQKRWVGIPLAIGLYLLLGWKDWRRGLRAILTAATAFGLSMAVASLLWPLVDRQRPPHIYAEHLVTADELGTCAAHPEALPMHDDLVAGSPAFPSRHGMTVGCLVGAFWMASRWLGLLAAVYGFFVAVGRVYLGRHWPSDVVVGVGIGLFAAWFVWRTMPAVLGRFGLRHLVEDPLEPASP